MPAGKQKTAPLYRGLRTDRAHPWRAENLGRVLLVATNRWQDAFVLGLREAGYRKVTSVYMNLMRHIDLNNGTRLTELAARVGTTKQAVGQLISTCTKLGLVDTVRDRADGRAKIVTFTEYGRNAMLAGESVIQKLDAEVLALVGPKTDETLREALRTLAGKNLGGAKARKGSLPSRDQPKKV